MEKTGIDDAMIERLVRIFYGRVQADPLIGPVFAARIEDWEAHMVKLCAFWSSVALMTGRYHGQPMQTHLDLPSQQNISTAGSRSSRRPQTSCARRRGRAFHRPRTADRRQF